jgi:hypothetical protein
MRQGWIPLGVWNDFYFIILGERRGWYAEHNRPDSDEKMRSPEHDFPLVRAVALPAAGNRLRNTAVCGKPVSKNLIVANE